MRPHIPDSDELDDEIRGHLAISIKQRIERGEDPETARLAALKEFGNVTLTRDSIRSVWRPRWIDSAEGLARDIKFALRALMRAKGMAATVVVTLALGIGANAAIFSVVRGVLLRPLVNRDEDRLLYIRQSAPGIGAENTTFSVPEIDDIKSRVTTINAFGDFSTVDFTMIGLGGEPRIVKAGVVSGSFFDGDGTSPGTGPTAECAGRWPERAGRGSSHPPVLDNFARQRPERDRQDGPPRPAQRDGGRRPRAIGALSGSHRDHRERGDQPASPRGDDGHEPHAPHDRALRPPCAGSDDRSGPRRADLGARRPDARAPRGVFAEGRRSAARLDAARSDRRAGAHDPPRAARRGSGRVRHRLLERRQPDPRALGAPRRRARRARCARRRLRSAPAHAAGRESRALRRRCRAGPAAGAPVRRDGVQLRCSLLHPRARGQRRYERALGWRRPGDGRGCPARRTSRACRRRMRRRASAWRPAASGLRRARTAACACSRRRRLRSRSCCSPARACSSRRSSRCSRRAPATTCGRCWPSTSRRR